MKTIPVSSRRLAKVFGLGLGLATVSHADPAKIVTQPSDISAPAESSASLKAEASGEPNTYRWFRSNGGGGALRFPGELQYVSVPIDVPETEYTVEFWFRTEDPNAGLFSVVDQNLGVGGHDRHIHLIDGNVRIRTWSGPGVEVSEGLNLADGKWHHRELPWIAGSRPKVLTDRNNNALLIWGAAQPDAEWYGSGWFRHADLKIAVATAKSGYTDWRIAHVERGPFANEMLADTHQWQRDGTLSVMVQETAAHHVPSRLRIVEFRIRN